MRAISYREAMRGRGNPTKHNETAGRYNAAQSLANSLPPCEHPRKNRGTPRQTVSATVGIVENKRRLPQHATTMLLGQSVYVTLAPPGQWQAHGSIVDSLLVQPAADGKITTFMPASPGRAHHSPSAGYDGIWRDEPASVNERHRRVLSSEHCSHW